MCSYRSNGTKASLRTNRPEVFLEKGVLKLCSKFTGEHPCRSVISINLLHIFRTPFPRKTTGRLLLKAKCVAFSVSKSHHKQRVYTVFSTRILIGGTLVQVFSCEFGEIFEEIFFIGHPPRVCFWNDWKTANYKFCVQFTQRYFWPSAC